MRAARRKRGKGRKYGIQNAVFAYEDRHLRDQEPYRDAPHDDGVRRAGRQAHAAFNQLAMSHDYHIEPMREFAERIHRHGAKFFVQLHHPGRQNVGIMVHMVPLTNMCSKVCKSFPKLVYKIAPGIGRKMVEKGLVFASPGPSKCEPSKVAGGHVRAFSHREIKKLIREFIDAAVRCKKAGVDGVELHAAHGYLLQQFLSPNTNKRTDEYGGSFENRLRFIKEIIEGIRKECGKDYPLIVRLAVDECYDKIGQPGKGYGLETGVKYAKAFEAMGVDAIDVSSAAYDTYPSTAAGAPIWRKPSRKRSRSPCSPPTSSVPPSRLRSSSSAVCRISSLSADPTSQTPIGRRRCSPGARTRSSVASAASIASRA